MIMASCVWRNNSCNLNALAAHLFRRSLWLVARGLNFSDHQFRRLNRISGRQDWSPHNQVIRSGANGLRGSADPFLIAESIAGEADAGCNDQKIGPQNLRANDFDLLRRSNDTVQSAVSGELGEVGHQSLRQ